MQHVKKLKGTNILVNKDFSQETFSQERVLKKGEAAVR